MEERKEDGRRWGSAADTTEGLRRGLARWKSDLLHLQNQRLLKAGAGESCDKGRHICATKGCHEKHPHYSCPNKRQDRGGPEPSHQATADSQPIYFQDEGPGEAQGHSPLSAPQRLPEGTDGDARDVSMRAAANSTQEESVRIFNDGLNSEEKELPF